MSGCGRIAPLSLNVLCDDALSNILDHISFRRDVSSLFACLATSRHLCCLSRAALRRLTFLDLVSLVLELPPHLASHVSMRCMAMGRKLPKLLLGDAMYPAVRQLLRGTLPADLAWLVTREWSNRLAAELDSPALADGHYRRWRVGCAGMPKGRYYRLGGLDDKSAAEHRFVFQETQELSVAEWFEQHRQQTLARPEVRARSAPAPPRQAPAHRIAPPRLALRRATLERAPHASFASCFLPPTLSPPAPGPARGSCPVCWRAPGGTAA